MIFRCTSCQNEQPEGLPPAPRQPDHCTRCGCVTFSAIHDTLPPEPRGAGDELVEHDLPALRLRVLNKRRLESNGRARHMLTVVDVDMEAEMGPVEAIQSTLHINAGLWDELEAGDEFELVGLPTPIAERDVSNNGEHEQPAGVAESAEVERVE